LKRSIIILALLILVLPAGWLGYLAARTRMVNRAQPIELLSSGETPRPAAAALQNVLDTYSAGRDGVGLQAAVIFPDGEMWAGTAGYADHARATPLRLGHRLYIGSMTKPVTAALVMRHVERGLFALDDPLDRWISLPYAGQVTVRMLLNHTSGIPSYTDDAVFLVRYLGLPQKNWQPAELLAVIQRKPLDFEPGTRHIYSNANYLLLGMILEQAAGVDYAQLLQDEIAQPLSLRALVYRRLPPGTAVANAYDDTLLRLGRQNLTGMHPSLESGAYAAGGVLSTAPDMARFIRALMHAELVSSASLESMLALVEAPDEDVPAQVGYGLGLRSLRVGGQPWVGHTGTIPGYSGFALHNPERDQTVVVLSNLSVIDQIGLLEALQAALEPVN
jgi:D-alanyl-D-alanine carboxypeptidase